MRSQINHLQRLSIESLRQIIFSAGKFEVVCRFAVTAGATIAQFIVFVAFIAVAVVAGHKLFLFRNGHV